MLRKLLSSTIVILIFACVAVGCTDAQRSSYGAYFDRAEIFCYSGGKVIFQDQSTGKVEQLDGEGLTYRSAKSGKYIRAYADCILVGE